MRLAQQYEYPERLQPERRKAILLEWITFAYLLSVVGVMYLVMGASQAMKAAWLEDSLSLIPPLSFLIAIRLVHKAPSKIFPFGFHRASSIAYLAGSLALFLMGAYLMYDSSMALLKQEKPTIPTVHMFGTTVWMGWIMIAVLTWSGLPAAILGRMKLPLARKLNDKALYADAAMNSADWQTAAAAIVGILGIGLGFWWADAVAALFISFSIIHDGFSNLKDSGAQLLDRTPEPLGSNGEKLRQAICDRLNALDWIEAADVRLREVGHLVFGDAFLTLTGDRKPSQEQIEEAERVVRDTDWRVGDVALAIGHSGHSPNSEAGL
ncbi:cation diffusion facilitator family transporter [Henriciella aquimarina]|uniref:cation diffusion facilitator family transporter n=1 Tax=Henriciella aquimarina TaxID=545261 RepID=UPI000A068537|nr:cation diffusion facilitator family transporter [Henriciella aquimarina]